MRRLFEPVHQLQSGFWWDYKVRVEHNYKGYYHWHQCCEWMLVHEGKGTVVVDQKTYDIKRGMVFLFEPYQLHQVYAEVSPEQPYVRSIFYTDPVLMEECLHPFPTLGRRLQDALASSGDAHVYALTPSVTATLEAVYERYNTSAQDSAAERKEALSLLLMQLLYWLPEEVRQNRGVRKKAVKRPLRYAEIVMRWIEEHYAEEQVMEQLAKATHLTPNYLSRVFRQETGSSITDYLIARRIRQACLLLETTDLSVEHIGQQMGYANTSYFIHLFKRQTGLTPLKYRRAYL